MKLKYQFLYLYILFCGLTYGSQELIQEDFIGFVESRDHGIFKKTFLSHQKINPLEVNEELALREQEIRGPVSTQKDLTKINLAFLGCTLIIDNNGEKYSRNIIFREEIKPILHTSTTKKKRVENIQNASEKCFVNSDVIPDVEKIYKHINLFFPPLSDLKADEGQSDTRRSYAKKIRKSFEEIQNDERQSLQEFKKSTEVREAALDEQLESIKRSQVIQDKLLNNVYVKDLKNTATNFAQDWSEIMILDRGLCKTVSETFERNSNIVDILTYNFWHSEQRWLNELITPAFKSKLYQIRSGFFKEKVTGILLNFHSKYNYCYTCMATIVEAASKSIGPLFQEVFQNEFMPKPWFHVLASFSLPYESFYPQSTTDLDGNAFLQGRHSATVTLVQIPDNA